MMIKLTISIEETTQQNIAFQDDRNVCRKLAKLHNNCH
jgi:hypothetical protein